MNLFLNGINPPPALPLKGRALEILFIFLQSGFDFFFFASVPKLESYGITYFMLVDYFSESIVFGNFFTVNFENNIIINDTGFVGGRTGDDG